MTCSCGRRVNYYNTPYNNKISWISDDVLSKYPILNYIRLRVTNEISKDYIFVNNDSQFYKEKDYYAIQKSDIPDNIIIRKDGILKN